MGVVLQIYAIIVTLSLILLASPEGDNPVKPEIANTFTFIYPCGIDIRFSFFRYSQSCKCFK